MVKITKVVQHYCQLFVYNLLVLTNQTYSKVMTFVCLKYLPSKHYMEMRNAQSSKVVKDKFHSNGSSKSNKDSHICMKSDCSCRKIFTERIVL